MVTLDITWNRLVLQQVSRNSYLLKRILMYLPQDPVTPGRDPSLGAGGRVQKVLPFDELGHTLDFYVPVLKIMIFI